MFLAIISHTGKVLSLDDTFSLQYQKGTGGVLLSSQRLFSFGFFGLQSQASFAFAGPPTAILFLVRSVFPSLKENTLCVPVQTSYL